MKKSFKDYLVLKKEEVTNDGVSKDWKKEHIQLEKGFIPPSKLRPVVEAFLNSGDIKIMSDTSKDVTMGKKPLFLTGGSVRDFLKGKAIKQFHLVTPATPQQIALILHGAGFKMDEDRSAREGAKLKLTFDPKEAKPKDKKRWFVLDREVSKKSSIIGIGAEINKESFEIYTFRNNPKTTHGSSGADFVDNPIEDANGRDLNINAMYLELSKPDGENNKLYDPTGKGWHDAKNSIVRTVGKAEDRFKEDPTRVMRSVRFHSRFGKGNRMDADIERAISRFKNMDGVDPEDMTKEFLKGLLHSDVNVKHFISILARTGLLEKIFPDIEINTDIPAEFAEKRDKPLAIAWLLKDNPTEEVNRVLSNIDNKGRNTGWSAQDKKAVIFLLELMAFSPQQRPAMLKKWKGTGLSKDQIRDWVDMFKFTDSMGRVKNRRPTWANSVISFSNHDQPLANWDDVVKNGMHGCPSCGGPGCPYCGGMGDMPEQGRSPLIDAFEIQKFMDIISKIM